MSTKYIFYTGFIVQYNNKRKKVQPICKNNLYFFTLIAGCRVPRTSLTGSAYAPPVKDVRADCDSQH